MDREYLRTLNNRLPELKSYRDIARFYIYADFLDPDAKDSRYVKVVQSGGPLIAAQLTDFLIDAKFIQLKDSTKPNLTIRQVLPKAQTDGALRVPRIYILEDQNSQAEEFPLDLIPAGYISQDFDDPPGQNSLHTT